jgi:membrane fusion protein (multidrug efflux system)
MIKLVFGKKTAPTGKKYFFFGLLYSYKNMLKPKHPQSKAQARQAHSRRQRYLWIGVPVLILLVIVALLMSRNIKRKRLQAMDTQARTESILPVKVMEVKTEDLLRQVRCSGIIKAWQQAIILSEVAGRVKSISAKVGDLLQPDAPILKIDDEMHKYTVEQAEANVLKLEANRTTSRRELKRQKSLFKNKVIADYEFDLAKAKEKADLAMLNSAKASLKIARRDLRETLITSPIEGILAERFVDTGTNVTPGTRVATVVETNQVKIKVGISEKEIGEIKEGQEVSIETDAYPGQKYTGSVYSVGTKADDSTLSFPIEIVVNNIQNPVLKPGMVARAIIKTGIYSDVMALPQEAVLNKNQQPFVWIVDNGTVHKVLVTPTTVAGSQVIINSSLKPGSLVVVSGLKRVFEGSRVQIMEE